MSESPNDSSESPSSSHSSSKYSSSNYKGSGFGAPKDYKGSGYGESAGGEWGSESVYTPPAKPPSLIEPSHSSSHKPPRPTNVGGASVNIQKVMGALSQMPPITAGDTKAASNLNPSKQKYATPPTPPVPPISASPSVSTPTTPPSKLDKPDPALPPAVGPHQGKLF